MWYFRSVEGFWMICEHDQHYVLMFNGECLAAGRTPSDILKQLDSGLVEPPICGLDPASVGLPRQIKNWTEEKKAGPGALRQVA